MGRLGKIAVLFPFPGDYNHRIRKWEDCFVVRLNPIISVSVIIPYYDDFSEAVRLANLAREGVPADISCELILVQVDPAMAPPSPVTSASSFKILCCPNYSGLPSAKNIGVAASTGELILFLFPGLTPEKGSIERLVRQLQIHPEWGAVAGRWNNERGEAEKGYNVRMAPTFLSLVFDVLFINKIFPANGITRRYKMHDFDHCSLIEVMHANDCTFMTRRSLVLDLGKFNETYRFSWFDQVEMCASLSKAGRPVYFDPDAVFTLVGQPLVNRILVQHYRDYHADLTMYVGRHYRSWQRRVFTAIVFLGMAIRLLFSRFLPRTIRIWLLRRYRSYVSDDYIQSMSGSYEDLFNNRRLTR
jgi:GT2 family glycosyltransferase